MSGDQIASGFGFIRDNKVFLAPFLTYPEKELASFDSDSASVIESLEKNYQQLVTEWNALKEAIEQNTNKGSFLAKLSNLRDKVLASKALGDVETLVVQIGQAEKNINDLIQSNRIRNLDIKNALLLEFEQLVAQPFLKDTYEELKNLQKRWVITGRVVEAFEQEVNTRYEALLAQIFEKKRAFDEDQKALTAERVLKYNQLIESISKMNTTVPFPVAVEAFNAIRSKWDAIGYIPKKEKDALWLEFKKAGDHYFESVKNHQQERKKPADKSVLEAKKSIINELAALHGEPKDAFTLSKQYQQKWKETGFAAKEGKDLEHQFKQLIQVLDEWAYLQKFITDRHKKELGEHRTRLMTKVMREWIQRDENEIKQYQHNSENITFTSKGGGFDKLIHSNLAFKEKQLAAKRKVYEVLKSLS